MQKQAVVFNGQEVGIAVPVENSLKFIAVRFNVIDLDNRLFDTVTEIRRGGAHSIAFARYHDA